MPLVFSPKYSAKIVVKGCVIKTATKASFDHVLLANRVISIFLRCIVQCLLDDMTPNNMTGPENIKLPEISVQGDTSGCSQGSVAIKTKVPFYYKVGKDQ